MKVRVVRYSWGFGIFIKDELGSTSWIEERGTLILEDLECDTKVEESWLRKHRAEAERVRRVIREFLS